MKENSVTKKIQKRAPRKPAQKKLSNDMPSIGFTGNPIPGLQGTIYPGAQVSQSDTLFANIRNYMLSNNRILLSQIYVEIGLVQTIVDLPVDDGLRGGVIIKSKQISEEQIQELQTALEREDDLGTMGQGIKWNRLYGGGAILIVTGCDDPSLPFDPSEIGPELPLGFRAIDMWELYWDQINTPNEQAMTSMDLIKDPLKDDATYNYYGMKIHKSRVMKLKGRTAPSFVRPRLRGWGLSEVETLVRSINQYLKSTDLCFEVLDEFKLDIYKIKNLTNTLMSANGNAAVRQRVNYANAQKNFQSAITMDSEDDYIQKELSFAGLAEAMDGIRKQVASDMRMPLTKIFGISAAGFSSGEDDIENYNAMIESQVRQKSKFDLLRMIELRCQQLFGMIPEDLQISFHPLRVLSAVDEENVKSQKFNRLMQAKSANDITDVEFRDGCNRDNLLSVQLDTNTSDLDDAREAQAVDVGDDATKALPDSSVVPDDDEDDDEPEELREETDA